MRSSPRLAIVVATVVVLIAPANARTRSQRQSESQGDAEEPRAKQDRGGGDWSLSGGIAPGEDSFAAQVGVGYGITRFLATDLSLHYESLDQNPHAGAQSGGTLAMIARAVNPTMLTPFIGAGPGYEKWNRATNGVTFDTAASATATGIAGIAVRLGSSLGIQAQRQQLLYLQDSPRKWSDHSVRERKARFSNQIGFIVSF